MGIWFSCCWPSSEPEYTNHDAQLEYGNAPRYIPPPPPSNGTSLMTGLTANQMRIRELQEKRQRQENEHNANVAAQIRQMNETTERMHEDFRKIGSPESYGSIANSYNPNPGSVGPYAYEPSTSDQQYRQEFDELRIRNDEELKAIQRENQRERERFNHNQELYKIKKEVDRAELAKREEQHKRELDASKRIFEEKLKLIQEGVEREKQESDRKWRERQAELDRQYEEIMRVLRMVTWNRVIENNWTNRLNFLRSANNEVKRLCDRLLADIRTVTHQSSDGDISPYFLFLQPRISQLIKAINKEKQLMNTESANLSSMYGTTGKNFLLEIRKSTSEVSTKCEGLEYVVLRLENAKSNIAYLKSEAENINHKLGELCKASLNIPTLAGLRQFYYNEMNHQGGSYENGESYNIEEVF